MPGTIAILGTLDSKGPEHAYVADLLRAAGHTPLLIDVGNLDSPTTTPDIPRTEVLASLGEECAAIFARRDRGECVTLMAAPPPRSSPRCTPPAVSKVSFRSAAAAAPPSPPPRLMPAIVDVSGLNRVSRAIFADYKTHLPDAAILRRKLHEFYSLANPPPP